MLKRLVKLAIAILFYTGQRVSALVSRLLGRSSPPLCTILYYHAIAAEDRSRFAQQMDGLVRWTEPIALNAPGSLQAGKRYSAVTFDDGMRSVVENALPELAQRRIPCLIFMVVNAFGQTPQWLKNPNYYKKNSYIMTEDEMLAVRSDLVQYGSHTLTHPNLTRVTEVQGRRELCESREKLEALLKRPVTTLSFPFGEFNDQVVGWCRDAGYQRVFTTVPVPALRDPQEYVSGRVSVEPTDWPIEFYLKLMGAYQWLPAAFRLKRKMLRPRATAVPASTTA